MSHNGIHRSATSLSERVQGRIRLGARERFILLFALFNAMFCLLFLLLLQNRQLAGQVEVIQATATGAVTVQQHAIAVLEEQVDRLEDRIAEMLSPSPTPTVAPPTKTPNPPTSAPTATISPTSEPSPTATPVPPTSTYTPIPPTATHTPSPEPTHTPKPKPKPDKTKPPPRPELQSPLRPNTFQISGEAASLVYFRGNQPERNQGATSWDSEYAKSR